MCLQYCNLLLVTARICEEEFMFFLHILYVYHLQSVERYYLVRKCMNELSSVYSTHEIFAEAYSMR